MAMDRMKMGALMCRVSLFTKQLYFIHDTSEYDGIP